MLCGGALVLYEAAACESRLQQTRQGRCQWCSSQPGYWLCITHGCEMAVQLQTLRYCLIHLRVRKDTGAAASLERDTAICGRSRLAGLHTDPEPAESHLSVDFGSVEGPLPSLEVPVAGLRAGRCPRQRHCIGASTLVPYTAYRRHADRDQAHKKV